jgi:predicted O-methyltransferase YrrM
VERAQEARYEARYAIAREPVMLGIERCMCGCDYGADSWTTQSEADRLAGHLEMDETKRRIDLGTSAGWSGRYLARRCACSTVLADLPLTRIRIAMDRIHTDGMQDRVVAVVADAANPPFADRCVRQSAGSCRRASEAAQ